jgi:peptidoglycan/xylan/chitin deacetylase (PgdA/CDA1 family)
MTKAAFARLLYELGITRFAAWWHRKDVVILNYHDISEADSSSSSADSLDLTVSVDSFRSQLAYLRRRHHIISLREFLAAKAERRHLPDYSVVLTFDDGYRNFLGVAPLLIDHRVPATLFLVTNWMRPGDSDLEPTDHQAETLAWAEVQTLDQYDVFDFGSHTCSHPSLPTLSPEAIDNELRASLDQISSHVKSVIPALAYPNGAYSGVSQEQIASAGYACALTIDAGPNKTGTNPYSLHRQTIRGNDDTPMFAARLSCLTPWLYRLRAVTPSFLIG